MTDEIQHKSSPASKPQNPIWMLLFNIVLPVIILNQGRKIVPSRLGEWGPTLALLVAISLPFFYGLFDFIKQKKVNWISLIGLLNISVTGSFALLKLHGHWFWIKEAFFPTIIGVAIFFGNRLGRPFLYSLFWNAQVFQTGKIEAAIAGQTSPNQPGNLELKKLFIRATDLFSLSFFISASANFFLAMHVFLPINPLLSTSQQDAILNAQIARMTWEGYLIIAFPMMFFTGGVLWYLIRGLRRITGLELHEILRAEVR